MLLCSWRSCSPEGWAALSRPPSNRRQARAKKRCTPSTPLVLHTCAPPVSLSTLQIALDRGRWWVLVPTRAASVSKPKKLPYYVYVSILASKYG